MEHAASSFALRKPQLTDRSIVLPLLGAGPVPALLGDCQGLLQRLLLGTAAGSGCRLGDAAGDGPVFPSDRCHTALSETSSGIHKCAYPAGGCNI